MNIKKLIVLNLLILIIGSIGIVAGSYYLVEHQVHLDLLRRNALYSEILDGFSAKPQDITIDFSKPTSTGSSLIFGGAHTPPVDQTDAWNKLEEVGATFVRSDFFLEYSLPNNIKVEDYNNNKNDIQNPETWNQTFITNTEKVFRTAKIHHMKTMGIIDYAPAWLTYSHTVHGVPMDWHVYEDIVKKLYSRYRNNLDYVEIWNEPDYKYFLDIKNSGMTSQEAYSEIFYHAAKAIREVDATAHDGKKVLIGGSVSYLPTDTSMLEALLQNPDTRQYLDFVSYHNYQTQEPSWSAYKQILKQYNMDNLPIFITEWNYDPQEKKDSPYKTSAPAIIFTGNKLVDFLKMGLAGANYYSFYPIESAASVLGHGYLGFYTWKNGQSDLLPQGATWRLLSKNLGLGNGTSHIFTGQGNDASLNVIGFENSTNQLGTVVVNISNKGIPITIHCKDMTENNLFNMTIFFASANNNASIPVYQGLTKADNHNLIFTFFIPKRTVMGVLLQQDNQGSIFM